MNCQDGDADASKSSKCIPGGRTSCSVFISPHRVVCCSPRQAPPSKTISVSGTATQSMQSLLWIATRDTPWFPSPETFVQRAIPVGLVTSAAAPAECMCQQSSVKTLWYGSHQAVEERTTIRYQTYLQPGSLFMFGGTMVQMKKHAIVTIVPT